MNLENFTNIYSKIQDHSSLNRTQVAGSEGSKKKKSHQNPSFGERSRLETERAQLESSTCLRAVRGEGDNFPFPSGNRQGTR